MNKVEVSFLDNDDRKFNIEERELEKFEKVFPSAKIIRNHYNTESELEHDWEAYCNLPYSIKVLANERCLRAYKMKNEEMYILNKREFLKKDITNAEIMKEYKPDNVMMESNSIVNKMARDYMSKGGHPVVTTDNRDYDELKKQWYEYTNQAHDHRSASDNKSLELYGKKVPEVYRSEIKRYLMQDIDRAEYDDPIVSTDNSLAIEQMEEYLNTSNSLIESAIMVDSIGKSVNTPVEHTIYDMIKESFDSKLENVLYPVLNNSTICMTDEEVLKSLNNEEKAVMCEDSNFISLQAQLLGLAPSGFRLETADFNSNLPFNKLKHGWNPIIEFNEENRLKLKSRVNNIIRENCKLKFLPIDKVEMMIEESVEEKKDKQGLSVLIIKELDPDLANKDNDNTKVFLSFTPKDSYWYEFRNGTFLSKASIEDAIQKNSSAMVELYFVEMNDSLYNQSQTLLKDFNENPNKIRDVITKMKEVAPKVGNSKLFAYNLISTFLQKYLPDKKATIYILFSGMNPGYKEIADSYKKANIFEEYKRLVQSDFLEKTLQPTLV